MFNWSSEEKLAFDMLKDKITLAPILTLPDNSRPYRVKADSSDFATRAVLSQENPEDGKWHPVAVRGLPSHPTPDFGTLYTPLHLR